MVEKNELQEIKDWFETGKSTPNIARNFCNNRSDFNARLVSYDSMLGNSLADDCKYLLTASIGEVGNNCFDHNLGFWNGSPGCLFFRHSDFCIIADRGRGIKESLQGVYKLLPAENSYTEVAFEKVITGRAPESRGNGLKFTKRSILKCDVGFYCVSAGEDIYIGRLPSSDLSILTDNKSIGPGTLSLFCFTKSIPLEKRTNHEN